MRELEPIGTSLGATLEGLGVASLDVLVTLFDEWDRVAGEPWAGKSTPLILRRGELIVEAESGPAVGLLRYAVGELLRRLDDRLGPGIVESVRVRAAPRGGPASDR